ncbi:hypothetical protein [Actinomadura sp. 6K520]|jgi:hypothetical protein|uniref:hypothetical protein n=1 Tax=Actinomadura sp. 6K520 TaxID=2530364 RepID=UPI001046CC55|nr:hypothetical protein [Actinomadura sp. 6K520]TDE27415.1 hypothetical protein E1289_23210 [Actinomadura sp. 6K520]
MNLRRHGAHAAASAVLAAAAGYLINLFSNGPTWPLAGGVLVLVAALATLEYLRAGPPPDPPRSPGALDIEFTGGEVDGDVTLLHTDTPPEGDVKAGASIRRLGPLGRFTGVRIGRGRSR